MPTIASNISSAIFAVSMLWLIIAAFGVNRRTLADSADVDISFRRTILPSVLSGLAYATQDVAHSLAQTPISTDVAKEWLLIACIGAAACLLSGAVMVGIARRGQEHELALRQHESELGDR